MDHPYIIVLDLWQPDRQTRLKKRRKKLVNTYDNNLKADQVWSPVRSKTRRLALADAD